MPSVPHESPLVAFGAHPDDIEFGCGGIVAIEARAGRPVHLILCSRGEAGSHGTPEERVSEARQSASLLGATLEVVELDGDGKLEAKAAHALTLAGIIRRLRHSTVLAPTPVPNQHPDHARLGALARDAARLARYAGLGDLKGQAAHPIDQLLYYAVTPEGEPQGLTPVLVDISAPEIYGAWTAAMHAHASQVRSKAYVELQVTRSRAWGLRAGVTHAQALYSEDPLLVPSLAALGRGARSF